MQQACRQCQSAFEITQDDLAFYDKVSPVFNGKKELIPPPTLCPDCRLQRRLAFRNEFKLHRSTCGLCKKSMISSFPSDSRFPVYCNDCWWSDSLDPFAYGRDFDFSRPFLEQFQELLNAVPKAAVLQMNNENCEYNHLLAFSKNSYLCPGSYFLEDCLYIRKSQYCKDCANGNILNRCELMSDSTNCDNCSVSHHLINCRNCSFSRFLSDCTRLKDCFMCSGITNKQYHFKNDSLSREAYEELLVRYSRKSQQELLSEFQEFNVTVPKRAQIQLNCDGSTGDYLANCHNAVNCSDCFNIEDSKNIVECEGVKDSMDLTSHDKDVNLCYELSTGGEKSYLTTFCLCCCASPRTSYSNSCFYLSDGFGCDGFHARSQYCIFNKQYSKDAYEQMVKKIIQHMQRTGEWGEFFPFQMSLYAYNESVAFDYFPLVKEDVARRGWQWRDQKDEMPKVSKIIPALKLPNSIDEVSDDILNWVIECEATNRPYKIIKQELEFYRQMKIPIPHFHPDERHRRRMALRNPRKLWQRSCSKCGKDIQTTYAPERPEIVYCEECYLKEVY